MGLSPLGKGFTCASEAQGNENLLMSQSKRSSSIVMSNNTLANSLYESRVTYKFKLRDTAMAQQQHHSTQSPTKDDGSANNNSCSNKFLSFAIVRSWTSLSSSKCKLWDDRELDTIEGAKFFSFFLA